ncbi:MAG TPA: hypothetical protein VF398_09140 [bacterium]|jgi:hypothetical protein
MKKQLFLMAGAFLFLAALLSVAQAEEPKQEGKFFGKVFFDYFHDFSSPEIDPARISPAGQKNGFEFTRIYFGYDRDISENFSVRVLLDADYVKEYKLTPSQVTNAVIDSEGDTVLVPVTTYSLSESRKAVRAFVKNAYLAMNCRLVEGSKWYFGIIGMPFVGVPEAHWGYRSIYQLAMDKQGWGATADLGVGWRGVWKDMFQLEFALTNGGGFRDPEGDMFKLIELRPTAYLVNKSLTLSGFLSFETINQESNALILAFVGGYDHKLFRIGAEYSNRSFSDSTEVSLGSLKFYTEAQNNISLWVHVKPMDKLTLLARYDLYEPDADEEKDKVSMLIAGLDFHPVKNVRIIPNVQIETYEKDDAAATAIDESASKNTAFLTFEYGW